MVQVRQKFGASERRACWVLGQPRSTQRRATRRRRGNEAALQTDVVSLASRYGRYGYRRVTALLKAEGWVVNHKRVERIWREEGLKVPRRQPKRARLWLNDGSCIRLRPTHPGSVWSYDFTMGRTHDGRPLKLLTVMDENGFSGTPRADRAAKLESIVYDVEGMTCNSCAVGIQATVSRREGVKQIEVLYDDKTARVAFDPTEITGEQLAAAFEELGYKVSPKSGS